MAEHRTLWLLRHAQTEDSRPGHKDADRRLTSRGEDQARGVGEVLGSEGVRVDAVLCSSALRARQTLTLLGVSSTTSDVAERYYTAGTDTLMEAIRELPDEVNTALVVGHAPALPGVAYELANREISEPAAWDAIDGRYPAATLARLDFDGPWANLDSAALTDVHTPTATGS
jgi:phosphohistidine phosphatase